MKKYSFQSELTEEEIATKVLALPHISLSAMSRANSFYGDITKDRICIGHTPNTYFSNFTFFCGTIRATQNGTNIVGYFAPPIKMVIVPYCIVCVFMLLVGSYFGLLVGVFGCALLHLIQMLFLSINTQSKRNMLSFIANSFNSTPL
ncbi:hypothetical protein SDC9_116747 [bioreactor metagenome]|uniref:Uncharacterized protein n=1 Tax=bioreactor metagenome TaxID=1076179 RepID=A0A645BWM0_9ZZZZ